MNKLPLLICLAALLFPGPWAIHAIESTPPEALVHAVNFPEGDAAWSVVFKNETRVANPAEADASDPASAAAAKIAMIDIVRRGALRRDITRMSNGATTQLWWSENPPLALFVNPTSGHTSAMKAASLARRRFDGSSFSWVSAKSYLGNAPYAGARCQFYQMEVLEDFGDGLEKRIVRAWIDPKSMRPVALDNGSGLVTFAFKDAPPIEPLILPPAVQEKLKRYQAFYAPPRKPGN